MVMAGSSRFVIHGFSCRYVECVAKRYLNIDYNDDSHERILAELPTVLHDYHFELPGVTTPIERDFLIAQTSALQSANTARGIFKYYQINNSFEWMDGRMLFSMNERQALMARCCADDVRLWYIMRER